jgi:hypothetical protein
MLYVCDLVMLKGCLAHALGKSWSCFEPGLIILQVCLVRALGMFSHAENHALGPSQMVNSYEEHVQSMPQPCCSLASTCQGIVWDGSMKAYPKDKRDKIFFGMNVMSLTAFLKIWST